MIQSSKNTPNALIGNTHWNKGHKPEVARRELLVGAKQCGLTVVNSPRSSRLKAMVKVDHGK